MVQSPLFGRRIHIAGSVADDLSIATTTDVQQARQFVEGLVQELVRRGATFVLPVDGENVRKPDGQPICFDWLIWRALHASLALRPAKAPDPLAVAVQHHKNEEQIPEEFQKIWDELRSTDRVQIENVSHWNMNSKRMEAQARAGDILLALGGAEGVLFLSNLYHDAGKPVVPLNFPITAVSTGARRLFELGLSSSHASRLFQTVDASPHTWVNRINFTTRAAVDTRVRAVVELLEALTPPRAFAIRLLDSKNADFQEVQTFFDAVVQPVVEMELGYKLTVIDGQHTHEHPRIDQEIFAKLHRSSVVIADITGLRPNCFLELGYALGRPLPTMLTMKEGGTQPFDITTFACHRWKTEGTAEERKQAFRLYWASVRNRPPIVPVEPLIS